MHLDFLYDLHTSVGVFNRNDNTRISFELDPKLKIKYIIQFYPNNITEEKPTPEDQAMVDRYIKQLTDHVLETRVIPPLFNLQWLYELTFDEKKVLHLEDD